MSSLPSLRTLLGVSILAAFLATVSSAQVGQTSGSGTTTTIVNVSVTTYRITYSDGSSTTAELKTPAQASPPPGGFPVVVFVHALGANRAQAPVWQDRMIERGYAIWTYDVRGQGAWRRNPSGPRLAGTTLWGSREMVDLGEQLSAVAVEPPPGTVNSNAVCVAGISQGGFHAWTAALNSGGAIIDSVSGLGSVFPSLQAAIALDLVPDAETQRLPGGQFGMSFLNLALLPSSPVLVIDNQVQSEIQAQVVAGRPARLSQWQARDFAAELVELDVPVLHRHSWFDAVGEAGPVVDAFDLVPPTTPVRAVISTGGHATEPNVLEAEYFFTNADCWLDRFLRGIPNGIDQEPRFATARLPLGPNPTGAGLSWPHIDTESLANPEGVGFTFLHTDASGTLTETAPASVSTDLLTNRVAAGFSPQVWLDTPSLRTVPATRTAIPQSTLSYTSVLGSEKEIYGKPKLLLSSMANAPVASVAVTLHVTLPTGERAMLSQGGARLDAGINVPTDIEIRMSPIAVVLPAGSTLELRLSNLWITELPHLPALYASPTFTNFDLGIAHGDLLTRLALPIREPVPVLRSDSLEIDVTNPVDVGLDMFAGADCAGTTYLIAIGDRPVMGGTSLNGAFLPIDQGFLFNVFAQQANSPICPNFFSLLDSEGSTQTVFRSTLLGPSLLSLIGRDLRFIGIVADFANLSSGVRVTTPVDVLVR
ncbi:MAG: CocE/NonD family hydrolase C-terminal non-catalytic domain-containing protein [Planctomycetota bacterium]